jgi:hypothetical protein
VDLAREFPLIQNSSFVVRNGWARQNPEMVKDFFRAMLAANIWDVNGSWTEENLQATIEFLRAEGSVPADLKVKTLRISRP